jgi:hypothetical protein
MEQDKTFVLKKLGFSDEGFKDYIAMPAIPHAVYGTEETMEKTIAAMYRVFFKRT